MTDMLVPWMVIIFMLVLFSAATVWMAKEKQWFNSGVYGIAGVFFAGLAVRLFVGLPQATPTVATAATSRDFSTLLIIAAVLTGGVIAIASAAVTGYLVWRTRKDSHEFLFPAKPAKHRGAQNIDEFNPPPEVEEDGALGVLGAMNERFARQMASDNLKEGKV